MNHTSITFLVIILSMYAILGIVLLGIKINKEERKDNDK